MNPESSKETYVEGLIRSFREANEPFVSKRHIVWPKEMFIELELSPKQVQKLRRWKKQGHNEWFPMWFCSLERVLFVNEDLFHEWTEKKAKKP